MLIHADNRGVDHLGIIGSGDRVHDIASTRQPAASERSDCSKWSLYRSKFPSAADLGGQEIGMDTNLRVVGCISGQVRSLGIDTVSTLPEMP